MTADVRSYDAVAVIGAGLSAFGYPMTKQLPALLWQAVGEAEGAGEELSRRAGMEGPPKNVLGVDPVSVALGWQLARDLPQVRAAFQRAFANLDADRNPRRRTITWRVSCTTARSSWWCRTTGTPVWSGHTNRYTALRC